ncbi:MAG: hypothetical protein SVY15_02445 [Halobacteriota archaeon]|nr:hypothetical protein [Halobacteriota archaeon]
MLKRDLLILVMLLALITIVPNASALSATKVEFDKMPLSPGEKTELWIDVTNDGAETISNLVLTLEQSAEAQSAIGISDGSVGLGDLDRHETARAEFTIFASPEADDGIYNFNINVANDGGGTTQTLTTFTVQITGKPPYLIISETSYNVVTPGSTKEIAVTIKNVGSDKAKDVFLEVNPIPETEDGGTMSSSDLGGFSSFFGGDMSGSVGGMSPMMSSDETPPPFVVTGSGTRFFVGDLLPGFSREIRFMISADSGAEKGVYNLPVTINRQNGRSTSEYIGIIVSSKADLNVPDIRTDPIDVVPGEPSILMVTVENAGKNDAKSVRVLLAKNEYITGTKSDYVGTIAPDEDDTALFEIVVKDDAPDVVSVVFYIEYMDETGEYSFIEKGDVTVVQQLVGSSQDGRSSVSGYGTDFTIVAILFILVVSIIMVMIFYYGKKRQK